MTTTGAAVESVQATPGRLHALDAVRAYALLGGVVLHSVAAFLPDFPFASWRLEPSTTAAVIYYVIHFFRMAAFYFIAGFFARMMLERRGLKDFVKFIMRGVWGPVLPLPQACACGCLGWIHRCLVLARH